MSFKYARHNSLIGSKDYYGNAEGIVDLEKSMYHSNAAYLVSKGLTGNQGLGVGVSANTDMKNTNFALAPAGANPHPSNGSMSPSGTGNVWTDWGGDIFDNWGSWYIYDYGTNTAEYINFTNINGSVGTVYTETKSTSAGGEYTFVHGFVATGIYKVDVQFTDTSYEFAMGHYGNMGSDGNTTNLDKTYTAPWGILNYNHHFQTGSSTEIFYTYYIPKVLTDNEDIITDSVGFFTTIVGNDNLAIWTGPITVGATWYYGKTNDVAAWVANDIEVAAL